MPDPSGLHVPAWGGRRAAAALEWVRQAYGPGGHLAGPTADDRRRGHPCVLCTQRINYGIKGKADSLTVEHVQKRSTHPHLTWDRGNWRPAHATCNYAGNTGQPTDIGLTGL